MATVLNVAIQGKPEIKEGPWGVESFKQSIRVHKITGASYPQRIANAMAASGIPAYGAALAGYSDAKVIKKSARLDGNTTGFVTVEYSATNQVTDFYTFNLRGSTNQKESFVDHWGQQLSTTHTWGDADPDWPGVTEQQGGSISVLVQHLTVRAKGSIQTTQPYTIIGQWLDSVNSSTWLNGTPGQWLCTSVEAQELELTRTNNVWRFVFEFQQDPYGWQPEIWFKDSRTGRPPYGVVAGVGFKGVFWYPTLDYNSRFG